MDNIEYQKVNSKYNYCIEQKSELENKISKLEEIIYEQKQIYSDYLSKEEEFTYQKSLQMKKAQQMEPLCESVKFVSGYLQELSNRIEGEGSMMGKTSMENILLRMETTILENENKLSEYKQELEICASNIGSLEIQLGEMKNVRCYNS